MSHKSPGALQPREAILEVSDSPTSRILRLRDSYVLIFVAHGRLDVLADHFRLQLKASEALLLFNHQSEKIALCGYDEAEFYALGFRFSSHTLCNSGPSYNLFVPAHATLPRPERLTDLLRRYIAEQQRTGLSRLILYHFIVLALCEIAQAAGNASKAQCQESGFEIIASSVDAYIAAHYGESMGTLDIARELRYNPGYLERSYRQERGISLRQAIHNRRIKEACAQLLLQKDSPVSEIAGMCGYHDTTYFRRAFKQATNMTPSRFRTVNSGNHAHISTYRWDKHHYGGVMKRYWPAVHLVRSTVLCKSARRDRMFHFHVSTGVHALNAGLFVSPGYGTHATRIIDSYELIFVTQPDAPASTGKTPRRPSSVRAGRPLLLASFPAWQRQCARRLDSASQGCQRARPRTADRAVLPVHLRSGIGHPGTGEFHPPGYSDAL